MCLLEVTPFLLDEQGPARCLLSLMFHTPSTFCPGSSNLFLAHSFPWDKQGAVSEPLSSVQDPLGQPFAMIQVLWVLCRLPPAQLYMDTFCCDSGLSCLRLWPVLFTALPS